jgi:hypothetical protein
MTNSPQYYKLPQYNEKGKPYPWKDEPNFAYYTDANTGLDYFIIRSKELRYLNGFIVVQESDIELLKSIVNTEVWPFDVHNGVMFCDKYEFESFVNSPIYCIGFGCGRYNTGDEIPCRYSEEWIKTTKIAPPTLGKITKYRDIKYVQEECKKLAVQVADYLKKHRSLERLL